MKLLTLEDYQKAGETFWPKYWYIAKELGEGAKAEDILKVMEAVGGVALRLSLEEKEAPFGFNKHKSEEPDYSSILTSGPISATLGYGCDDIALSGMPPNYSSANGCPPGTTFVNGRCYDF